MSRTERCRGKVWSASGQVAGWGAWVPCQRRATKDGFCGPHHPDAVTKRQARAAQAREKADRLRSAQRQHEIRQMRLLDALYALTPEERATLPASLRALLTPEEPQP